MPGSQDLFSPLHPWLHGLGTALLIIAIPLLIFSGYCLDWAERKPKQTETGKVHHADQR